MRFCLIDSILEQTDDRIVAFKHVSEAEEYLQDHFPSFPILPGVMMIEAMAQAARRLLVARDPAATRWALGSVRALKYGAMVRPGDTLRLEVSMVSAGPEVAEFKGSGVALLAGSSRADTGRSAVAGRFTMRPAAPLPTPRG